MAKRVLVLGKTGQLGKSIEKISQDYKGLDFVFVGRSELDLSSIVSIRDFFNQEKNFDVIINAAAYTNVEQAEDNFDIANAVNHLAVSEIAGVAKEQNKLFIHVSTDYVFDGINSVPYLEEDVVNPLNKYGQTKWHGEQAILASGCSGIIVRTGWLYSEFGNNFVKAMLSLGRDLEKINVVYDQIGSPTYALDLAHVLVELSKNNEQSGVDIYHYSNEDACSWYEFAQAIFDMSHLQIRVAPIKTTDYAMRAARPQYSVLNKSKIKRLLNIGIPHWRDSLQRCLHALKKH